MYIISYTIHITESHSKAIQFYTIQHELRLLSAYECLCLLFHVGLTYNNSYTVNRKVNSN